MAIILGLDVSTSCTGFCVVDSDVTPDDKGSHILYIDRIEFKGCKTFWDKCDRIEHALSQIEGDMFVRKPTHGLDAVPGYKSGQDQIDRVVLEEPLMGFRPGMSSATTISQLLRFNGIVSNLARKTFRVDPEYISANHARKMAGIKLQRTAVAGMSQKEQVFKHMHEHDLKHVQWPFKKDGVTEVDWSRDATDAYVIAKAAALEGPIVPVKKGRKSKKADE